MVRFTPAEWEEWPIAARALGPYNGRTMEGKPGRAVGPPEPPIVVGTTGSSGAEPSDESDQSDLSDRSSRGACQPAGSTSDRSRLRTRRASPLRRSYWTRGRILRRVLLLLGIYLGMSGAIAWQTVRPKHTRMTRTPADYHIPSEPVSFRSGDGTRLVGWWIPAKGGARGAIILCHGVDSDRSAMLEKAAILRRHGYATLLFDFRARGESGGDRCTLGFREVGDLLAAVTWVQSAPVGAALPLGVFGESMGASVAIMGTARCPQIRAVAAESAFARLDHAVHNHFHNRVGAAGALFEMPVRLIGERLIGCGCDEVAPEREIGTIAPRPVLLIQDGDDILCPASEGGALFAAAGSPKELWTVPGAGHIEANVLEPVEFARRVTSFFDRSLAGSLDADNRP